MNDTTFAVEFRAFSFATEAEAKAFEEKLQDAFCAMPEADGVAAVSRVVKQNDPFAGVGIIPPPGPHVNFAETPAHIAALQKEAWEKSHGKKADDLVYRLAVALRDAFATANARIEHLEKLDREAATYVESVIAMRTHFTGNPPYVGWKGLGLALNEALDERDAAVARAERAESEARYWMRVNDELLTGCENESDIRLAHETDLASALKGKSQ